MKKKKTEYEKQIRRTIQKEKRKNLCMVLLLVVMLPYTAAILFGQPAVMVEKQEKTDTGIDNVIIAVSKSYGVEEMPLEEYLIGSVAAYIPGEYEEEAIKAQAVILRSNLYAKIGTDIAEVTKGRYRIKEEELAMEYLEEEERERLWGREFKTYEEKLENAVHMTRGLVVRTHGTIVSLPFCRISDGQTRDSEHIEYIKGVSCEQDVTATDFLQEKKFSPSRFRGILDKHGIAAEKITDMKVLYDNAGYVNKVCIDGCETEGEAFKEYFGLASSSFNIDLLEGKIRIRTKGIGHGFGMSQYMANTMAVKGEDFLTILHYFFQNIDIEKIV